MVGLKMAVNQFVIIFMPVKSPVIYFPAESTKHLQHGRGGQDVFIMFTMVYSSSHMTQVAKYKEHMSIYCLDIT